MFQESGYRPETDEIEKRVADKPESSVRERREILMERLDAKVETVLDFQRRISSLDKERDSSVIQQSLEEIWLGTIMLMSTDIMDRYEQLQGVEERLRASAIMDDQPMTPEAFRSLKDHQRQLRSEAQLLMENEDVQFLMNIKSVIDDLHHKHTQLETLRQQPEATLEKIIRHVYMWSGEIVSSSDVVRTIETPFETTLVLASKAYTRIWNASSLGLHFRRSPFSLTRQHKGVEATIRHESVHNILEGAGGIGQFTASQEWTEMQNQRRRVKTAQEQLVVETELAGYNPASLLDRMHNELLAELENWESSTVMKQPNLIERHAKKNFPFEFHSARYSTAGNDAQTIAATYEKVAKQCANPKMKLRLVAIVQEFKQEFVRAIEHIRQALIRARQLGEGAVEHLHALLFVLPPSRYRHLDRYLDERYGNDTNKTAEKPA